MERWPRSGSYSFDSSMFPGDAGNGARSRGNNQVEAGLVNCDEKSAVENVRVIEGSEPMVKMHSMSRNGLTKSRL